MGNERDADKLYIELLRQDFLFFVAFAVSVIWPGTKLEYAWHIDAICHQMARVAAGHDRRVILNMPPRFMKSSIVSVIFAAWCMGHNPKIQIICASYNDDLAGTLANDFRRLVMHPTFKRVFPLFSIDDRKNNATELRTTMNGYRLATSVGGTLTGRGADLIIVDDPLNAINAYSAVELARVNTWFDQALVTRLNKQSDGIILVVMQRLNQFDLTGHLTEKTGWKTLSLPARNGDTDMEFSLLSGGTFRWKSGADLMPSRLDRLTQERTRAQMGVALYSAQYDQKPLPQEGAIIKRAWLRYSDDLPGYPDIEMIIQSWDVAAKLGLGADFSVCTTWGVTHKGDFYLADVKRVRVEFPSLIKLAHSLYSTFKPTHILIEDASNGTALIQSLQSKLHSVVVPIRPTLDKESRLHAVSPVFEAGRVNLLSGEPWLDSFIEEITGFPATRHDDQVDSTTQAIRFAEERIRNRVPICSPWSTEKDDSWIF